MTTFILVAVFLIVAFLVVYIYNNFFTDIQAKLREARDAIENEAWQPARVLLENIVVEDEDSAEGHYLLAVVCRQQGDPERAIMELRKVLGLATFPGDANEEKVRRMIWKCFVDLNRTDDAYKELQMLRNVNANNAEYPFEIARILIKKGDYSDNVFQLLADAHSVNPELPGLAYHKGYVLYQNEDLENAKQQFIEATKHDNDDYDAHYFLGQVLYVQSQYQPALQSYQMAQKSSLYKKSAYFGAGKSLFQMGDFKRVPDILEASLQATRTPLEDETIDLEAYYMVGIAYENLKDYESALTYWDKAFDIDPEFQEVREKRKQYSSHRVSDMVVDLNTTSNHEFKEICDRLITIMGYNVLEVIVLKNGNCSALAKAAKGERELYALQFIRNKDFVVEEDVNGIKRQMFENRARKGIIATTGEISTAAEKALTDDTIQLLNHQALTKFLKKIEQASP